VGGVSCGEAAVMLQCIGKANSRQIAAVRSHPAFISLAVVRARR
jgi:hypothetical protein